MPSTLRSRQLQRRKTQPTSASATARAHADYTLDQTFNPPLSGIWNGRLVTIESQGNSTGMSATYKLYDEEGRPNIVSIGEVLTMDFVRIPPTVEQVESILSNLKFREA